MFMSTELHMSQELKIRSAIKAISYRLIIIALDFTVIYLMTGKTEIALGFMLISNLYTTLAYFIHERIWSKIRWGLKNESVT
jgi:adenylylsulfate kinase